MKLEQRERDWGGRVGQAKMLGDTKRQGYQTGSSARKTAFPEFGKSGTRPRKKKGERLTEPGPEARTRTDRESLEERWACQSKIRKKGKGEGGGRGWSGPSGAAYRGSETLIALRRSEVNHGGTMRGGSNVSVPGPGATGFQEPGQSGETRDKGGTVSGLWPARAGTLEDGVSSGEGGPFRRRERGDPAKLLVQLCHLAGAIKRGKVPPQWRVKTGKGPRIGQPSLGCQSTAPWQGY